MGRCEEIGEVKEIFPLTLASMAFLRVPLAKIGISADMGVVVVADDERKAQMFAKSFASSTGAKVLTGCRWGATSVENYVPAIRCYSSKDEESAVMDYLNQMDFLPILIVGGILPGYLKRWGYLFRLEARDVEFVKGEYFQRIYIGFREFVVSNIDYIMKELRYFKVTENFQHSDVNPDFETLFRTLLSVGYVWKLFLREKKTGKNSDYFWESYIQNYRQRVERMELFDGAYELSLSLSAVVFDYIGQYPDIVISSIDEVDGEVERAVGNGRAILYDDDFYFVQEPLFLKMCGPLLDCVSTLELKKALKDEGILESLDGEYTVKKMYVNSYGARRRVRFIKLNRNALISEDAFTIEELFGQKSGCDMNHEVQNAGR